MEEEWGRGMTIGRRNGRNGKGIQKKGVNEM
jgi:hypothetical protein